MTAPYRVGARYYVPSGDGLLVILAHLPAAEPNGQPGYRIRWDNRHHGVPDVVQDLTHEQLANRSKFEVGPGWTRPPRREATS